MKKEILSFATLFIFLALTLNVSTAHATLSSYSSSENQSWIYWTSLVITGGVEWVSQNSRSEAYAENDAEQAQDSTSLPGWVETNAYAPVTNVYGQSWTNDTVLYEDASALADGTSTMSGYADANAMYSGEFTATSDGYVSISVDFQISLDLYTEAIGKNADGFSSAGLRLHNLQNVNPVTDIETITVSISDGATFTDSQTGTLTVTEWFDELEEGSFRAWVYNQATVVVPEPATVALLGLGALSLLRRKGRSVM